jgi:hypothetical protein
MNLRRIFGDEAAATRFDVVLTNASPYQKNIDKRSISITI